MAVAWRNQGTVLVAAFADGLLPWNAVSDHSFEVADALVAHVLCLTVSGSNNSPAVGPTGAVLQWGVVL